MLELWEVFTSFHGHSKLEKKGVSWLLLTIFTHNALPFSLVFSPPHVMNWVCAYILVTERKMSRKDPWCVSDVYVCIWIRMTPKNLGEQDTGVMYFSLSSRERAVIVG